MPGGFVVLGAITASWGLFKDIVSFMKGVLDAKPAIPAILLRFENDSTLMAALATLFTEEVFDSLRDADVDHLQRVFDYLLPILQSISVRLRRYGRNKIWDKAKWAVVSKDLQSSEEDIYTWVQRLQNCLVLLPKSLKSWVTGKLGAAPAGAQSLLAAMTAQKMIEEKVAQFSNIVGQQGVLTDPQFRLPDATAATIKPSSSVQFLELLGTECAVEFKRMPASQSQDPKVRSEIEQEVAKLVAIFTQAEPYETYLLRPVMFFQSKISPVAPYGVIYSLPQQFDYPRSLADILSQTRSNGSRILSHSLDQRFELARQIATALLFVHSTGWLHKGMHSSNIVLAYQDRGSERQWPKYLGTAFLIGFEFSRRDKATSTGDETAGSGWERRILQHPSRSVKKPPEFTEEHDIYALGVLLVEIGRWKPLSSYRAKFEKATSDGRKVELETLAQGLGVTLGKRYVDVVLRCLRILDQSEQSEQDDGSKPAIRSIVLDLEELALATR